jgi:nitrite reductase (cytochrome c-552)
MRTIALVGLTLAAAGVVLSGCSTPAEQFIPAVRENTHSCGKTDCHKDTVERQALSKHREVRCVSCHPGVFRAHSADPKKAVAQTDWRIDSCTPCHADEARTYLYDDNTQAGPFGGSIRIPKQPKVKTFPEYNKIIAGHPFTKDYNEEGAHAWMLLDHYEIKRGKFDTCVQCKSTKVAYSWLKGTPLVVAEDTEIVLTHTATPTEKAKVARIPKGTVITYSTDAKTRQVISRAILPDGTTFSSQPKPSEDATRNFNMMWAATMAAIKETQPYGIGCNHCHDPHTSETRFVRKAMLESVAGTGDGVTTAGANPYVEGSAKDATAASLQDQRILSCAQCHVEYTCGKSSVDGIERDAYGWRKASGLHDKYTKQFDYKQDWKHKIIGKPLIKSQHPETELFWQSAHYKAGLSCSECHMPRVRGADGRLFRSHWFTSPYKYAEDKYFVPFARATGINPNVKAGVCTNCHEDRKAIAIAQQEAFFAQQAVVEKLLSTSVDTLGAVNTKATSGGRVNQAAWDAALTAHRKAHVLWENLAVSENSMGFHNFEEAMGEMVEAEKQARVAIAQGKVALGGK